MMSSRAIPRDFGSTQTSSGEQRPPPIFVPPLTGLSLGESNATSSTDLSRDRYAVQRSNSVASAYSNLPTSAGSSTGSFMLSPTSSVNDGSQFPGAYTSGQVSPFIATSQYSSQYEYQSGRATGTQQSGVDQTRYTSRVGGQSFAPATAQQGTTPLYSYGSSMAASYQRPHYQDPAGALQQYPSTAYANQASNAQVSAAGSAGYMYSDMGGMSQDIYAQNWQQASLRGIHPPMTLNYPHNAQSYDPSNPRRGSTYPTYYQDPNQR